MLIEYDLTLCRVLEDSAPSDQGSEITVCWILESSGCGIGGKSVVGKIPELPEIPELNEGFNGKIIINHINSWYSCCIVLPMIVEKQHELTVVLPASSDCLGTPFDPGWYGMIVGWPLPHRQRPLCLAAYALVHEATKARSKPCRRTKGGVVTIAVGRTTKNVALGLFLGVNNQKVCFESWDAEPISGGYSLSIRDTSKIKWSQIPPN